MGDHLREDYKTYREASQAATDIPRRTDIEAPVNYHQNKHVLFGQQEALCSGCRVMFPFRNFTVDHIIPRAEVGRTTSRTSSSSAGPATPSRAIAPRSTW